VPGRVLVLTFRPTRFLADLQAEAEFRALLGEVRARYRAEIAAVVRALEFLRGRRPEPTAPLPDEAAPPAD
jgi:hypothetical protein